MESQTVPQDTSPPDASAFTVTGLRDLQKDCARIAASGGEAGAIAAEISRIGTKLWELCEKAERALGR